MNLEKKNIISALFLFAIILFALNFVSARPLTCADNPIALWHFSEGSGDIITDSCNGIIGTINGSYSWINGKYGNSVLFNGVDTYADIGSQISQGFDEMSIMAWVKVDESNYPFYMAFVGRDYITEGVYVHNFALVKDFYYADGFFFSIYPNDAHSFFSPYDLSDKNWHLLVGTYNGSTQTASLYFDGNLVQSAGTDVTSLQSSTDYFLFGASFNNDINNIGYFLNGSLDEVAIFNRTLSQEEISDYYADAPLVDICSNQTEQQLILPSYPYVDLNRNYPLQYFAYTNDILSYIGNVSIDIKETDGTNSTFNFTWNYGTNSYDLTLLFNQIGDYPFTIYSSCLEEDNFTGIFLVKEPFNITFCAFNQDSNYASYVNNYAYLIAEPTSSKKYYDTNLETYLTPLGFASTYKTPTFHTLYRNGCGTFKMYEAGEYAIRLFDGVATFQTTYSAPNISKTYGTNIYLGKFAFNGTDDNYSILLRNQDIHQYRWLLNWAFVILIGFALLLSVVLVFLIPQYPIIPFYIGIGFISMACLLRIVIWIVWRY